MYEAFFSLEDAPFVLTPDPRFLLRSKGHHEILSSLLYGVTSQKGLMALIGDVGTGKTTLCRALLRELPAEVQSALVLNPHLSDVELVGTILDDLGVERRGATKGELMTTLNQHLLAAGEAGKTVVVVLDEAQQMSVEALEQIRILSTLETATRKLLQIVLVGQPELEDKLRRHELRQLDQRIGIRCYLAPLSRKDTARYVEHRLRVAGLPGALPFSRAALAGVHRWSGGVPRMINLLCDRALMAAFSARAHEVTPALVRTAARNLDGRRSARRWAFPRRPGLRRLATAAAFTGIAVLAGAAAASVFSARTPVGSAPGAALLSAPAAYLPRLEPAVAGTALPAMAPAADAPSDPAGPDARGIEPVRGLLGQLLRLWGVTVDLGPAAVAAWPVAPGGALDVVAVAARHHLAATFLADTSLGELRAVGLPALIGLDERGAGQTYLLRRLDRESATLVGAAGDERRVALDRLDPAWTRAAWVVWRNVDLLPTDPAAEMTSTVIATVNLRLAKLGFGGGSLEDTVRRFQRASGLPEDGILGPRTTLALARATSGPFAPSLTAR
jgi:general secretion pathway protein A